jgi:hypothetical protein
METPLLYAVLSMYQYSSDKPSVYFPMMHLIY